LEHSKTALLKASARDDGILRSDEDVFYGADFRGI